MPFSLLRAIPASFHSAALYRDVFFRWEGFGFLYVLVVIAVTSTPVALVLSLLSLTVTPDHPLDLRAVTAQVPPMVFTHGELSVQVPQPYHITFGEDKEVIAIIDTTQDPSVYNKPDFRGIVFGKTQAVTRDKANESRVNDYPKDLDMTFDRATAEEWVETFLRWLWLLPWLTLPFIIGAFFLYRIAQLFLYGLFGLAIAHFTKTAVSYKESVRLASVALTPAIILWTVTTFLVHVPISAYVYFILAMVYLWFAMKANSSHA